MGLRNWLRRRRSPQSDIREELEAHIALRAEYDASDANAARKRLGNMLHTQEEMRRVWVPPLWDALVQDARYTWRSWRRNPGFAIVAIATLSLGIGANTAMFTVAQAVLFRSLPYAQPDRLILISETNPLKHWTHAPASHGPRRELSRRHHTTARPRRSIDRRSVP